MGTSRRISTRRRAVSMEIRTWGSFSTEASALVLLYGLIASGTIRMRRIDGYPALAEVMARAERKIA